jgi:dihydroorotate dehydrogenase (NAD+) catalytic subunit
MGGIGTGRDVEDFVAAGARAVALGTVLFSDPWAPDRIRSELGESVLGENRMQIGQQ